MVAVAAAAALGAVSACVSDDTTPVPDGGGGPLDGAITPPRDGAVTPPRDGATSTEDGGRDGGTSTGDGGAPDGASSDGGDASFVDASQTCSDYVPTAATTPTTVRVENKQDAGDIYVSQNLNCTVDSFFVLKDAQDAGVKIGAFSCDPSCSMVQSQCEACVCQPTIITKIAPGGYYDTAWPGTGFSAQPMPAKCYADAGCAKSTCLVERALQPGTFTVEVPVHTAPLCDGGSCLDCTPGGFNKNCTVPQANGLGGTRTVATATWTGQSPVTVQVQPTP